MIVFHLDVLASQSERLITRVPSMEGRRLWNTFFDQYKGRIVLVADEGTDLEILKEWLKRERFKPSLIHVANDLHLHKHTPRAGAVWWVNSNLGKITWYIDTDPVCCAAALSMGVPSLVVAVPTVIRPEWDERPDIRPWDSLVEELDAQALRKSEREWGDE